jgi:hypothetical protein
MRDRADLPNLIEVKANMFERMKAVFHTGGNTGRMTSDGGTPMCVLNEPAELKWSAMFSVPVVGQDGPGCMNDLGPAGDGVLGRGYLG